MSAEPSPLRFFVDESLLGLGKILARARRDVAHPGHRLVPEIPEGTLDPDWMPRVAARDLAVIIRDKKIRTKDAELLRFREEGLRVFWIADKRDLNNWGYLVRVVRWWDAIEETVATKGPGPWGIAITSSGLSDVSLEPRVR